MDPRVMNPTSKSKSYSDAVVGDINPPSNSPEYPIQTSKCSVTPYEVISYTTRAMLDEKEKPYQLILLTTKESDGTSKTSEYVKKSGFPVMPR